MSRLTEILVRKHTMIASFVVPTSVALGFLYTQHTGKHAFAGSHHVDPAVALTYHFKLGGIASK